MVPRTKYLGTFVSYETLLCSKAEEGFCKVKPVLINI